MKEQEQFSSPLLAQLIFKRAELMHRVSRVDDYQFNTQKMKDCLKDVSEPTDFNEELMVQIVKKIIIYKDWKIET